MEKLDEILKKFGSACYWYGEDTGDDNMSKAGDEDFFKEAKAKILEITTGEK